MEKNDKYVTLQFSAAELCDLIVACDIADGESSWKDENRPLYEKLNESLAQLIPKTTIRKQMKVAEEHLTRMFRGYVSRRKIRKETAIKRMEKVLGDVGKIELYGKNCYDDPIDYTTSKSIIEYASVDRYYGSYFDSDYWYIYESEKGIAVFSVKFDERQNQWEFYLRIASHGFIGQDINGRSCISQKAIVNDWAKSRPFLCRHMEKIKELKEKLSQ